MEVYRSTVSTRILAKKKKRKVCINLYYDSAGYRAKEKQNLKKKKFRNETNLALLFPTQPSICIVGGEYKGQHV